MRPGLRRLDVGSARERQDRRCREPEPCRRLDLTLNLDLDFRGYKPNPSESPTMADCGNEAHEPDRPAEITLVVSTPSPQLDDIAAVSSIVRTCAQPVCCFQKHPMHDAAEEGLK